MLGLGCYRPGLAPLATSYCRVRDIFSLEKNIRTVEIAFLIIGGKPVPLVLLIQTLPALDYIFMICTGSVSVERTFSGRSWRPCRRLWRRRRRTG